MKTTNLIERKGLLNEVNESGLETVTLSISEEGAEHLMGTLTNLYSLPAESVFREVISNAYDSHLKTGSKAAIEVNLVGSLFIVQDFGTGMSKEEIVEVYSKYGSSTKRDSNTQIGAFGLGAKSPLAITDKFDITSIKDGNKIDFYIKKNSRGVGVIHFVSETKTTEPNGVKVTIPLTPRHTEAMNKLVRDGWFSTWIPKSVKFNGAFIKNEGSVYNKDEFFTLYDGNSILGWVKKRSNRSLNQYGGYYSHSVQSLENALVISGIKYASSTELESKISDYNTHFLRLLRSLGFAPILSLPLGSVDLTPNRESLMVTDKTINAVSSRISSIAVEMGRVFAKNLNTFPDREEALDYLTLNLPAFNIVNKSQDTNHYSLNYVPEFVDNVDGLTSIQYKGENVPFSVKLNLLVMNAKNATAWNDKWEHIEEVNLFNVLNRYPHNLNKSNYYQSSFYCTRQVNKFTTTSILVYGKDTVENRKIILRNARSFSLSKQGTKYVTVYFHPSEKKPTNKWLPAALPVVSITQLEEGGLAYRREIAKEAAKNAVKTPRSKAIHFGAYLDSSGDFIAETFAKEDFAKYDRVIIIPQEAHQKNRQKRGNYASVAYTFWDYVTKSNFTGSNLVAKPVLKGLLLPLAKLFPKDLIILVPTTRSLKVIEKVAGSKGITLESAFADELTKLKEKDPERFEVLKFVNQLPTRELIAGSTGSGSAFNRIDAKDLNLIRDDITRESIREIITDGSFLKLIEVFSAFSRDVNSLSVIDSKASDFLEPVFYSFDKIRDEKAYRLHFLQTPNQVLGADISVMLAKIVDSLTFE